MEARASKAEVEAEVEAELQRLKKENLAFRDKLEASEAEDEGVLVQVPWGVLVLAVIVFLGYIGFAGFRAGMGLSVTVIAISLMVNAWAAGRIYQRDDTRRELRQLDQSNRELRRELAARDKVPARARTGQRELYCDLEFVAAHVAKVSRIKDPNADDPMFEVPQPQMIALADALDALRESGSTGQDNIREDPYI